MGYAKIIKHLFLEYYISIYKKKMYCYHRHNTSKNMGVTLLEKLTLEV